MDKLDRRRARRDKEHRVRRQEKSQGEGARTKGPDGRWRRDDIVLSSSMNVATVGVLNLSKKWRLLAPKQRELQCTQLAAQLSVQQTKQNTELKDASPTMGETVMAGASTIPVLVSSSSSTAIESKQSAVPASPAATPVAIIPSGSSPPIASSVPVVRSGSMELKRSGSKTQPQPSSPATTNDNDGDDDDDTSSQSLASPSSVAGMSRDIALDIAGKNTSKGSRKKAVAAANQKAKRAAVASAVTTASAATDDSDSSDTGGVAGRRRAGSDGKDEGESVWEYQEDDGTWHAVATDLAAKLMRQNRPKPGRDIIKYKLGKYSYEMDMQKLVQTNLATKTQRALRKVPKIVTPVIAPPAPVARPLTAIDLSFNAIHARAFLPLASVMMMHGLTVLNIASNDIGYEGYNALAKAFTASPACGLRFINLTATGLTPAAANVLAPSLKRQRYLQHLIMDNNTLDDASVTTLATAFTNHQHLQSWSLQWNAMQYTGLTALLATAATCTQLRSLHVGSNKIAIQGGRVLIAAIQAGQCRYLTSLNLFGNRFRDRGVISIADGLHTIKLSTGFFHADRLTINIGRNEVGDAGLVAICDAWERNLNLLDVAFRLDGNDCTDDTAARVADLSGVRALAALLVRAHLYGTEPGHSLNADVARLIASYAFDKERAVTVATHAAATDAAAAAAANGGNGNGDDDDDNNGGEEEEEEEEE